VMGPPLTPAKLCPGAKVMIPFAATDKPVSAGLPPLPPNNKFSVPDGAAVLLLAGSACQRNTCC